jgi:UPF0716 family protein affecting phage T7 exclusion
MWERAVLIAAAFLLIKPGWITDLIGLALLAAVVAAQLPRRRAAASVLPTSQRDVAKAPIRNS